MFQTRRRYLGTSIFDNRLRILQLVNENCLKTLSTRHLIGFKNLE